MRFPGFIGPSYELKSVNVECQRCINLYPEVDEAGTEKDGGVAALIGTPGLTLLAAIGLGPMRGAYMATNGVLYVCSANKLYTVSSAWVATLVGTLLTATGPVSMIDNGISLFIVDNPNGYYTTLGTTVLTQTTDPNWKGATQVSLFDGFFVFNYPNTSQFYVSNLLSTVINPLGFASKESPDYLVGFIADHRNLWLFGQKSSEVWFDAGVSPGVPFQVIQGAYMEVGCAAAFSIAQVGNTLLWLGQDPRGTGIVYMTNGYNPQRVSTHAVELAIQGYGSLSSAVAWTYEENGHNFYCLNFTGAPTTWCFDLITGLWHERSYLNSGIPARHLAQCHAFAYGVHVVGDYSNGNLYQLSSSVFSDNGSAIQRRRASPHLSDEMHRIFFSRFQLDFEPGVGIDGLGQGITPQAMLQWSDDGGHNWSNENWTGMGPIGRTKTRAIWRRLGHSRNRVFRVTITDPVEVIMIGAQLDVTASSRSTT